MGFLDSLKSEDNPYWVYVRCRRCGEVIKTRIDLSNDLSLKEEGGFIVNKTLIGGSQLCFERIEVSLTFDSNRQLIERDIRGGDFISAEEYNAGAAET